MCPGSSFVEGFINASAAGKVRALQSFTASNVNDAGVGGSNGQRSDRAGGLIVEYGIPSVAEVSGFPDATINSGHVENIWLVRHASDGDGSASAERSNAAPAHLGKELRVELLRDC